MNLIETAVQGVKDGETHLFEIIIQTYQQQLFHYCYHMLGNIQEAEDAVQESFLKAYEKIGDYKKSVSFSAWLYKITHNHCINVLRRKKLLHFISLTNDTENENQWSYYRNNGLKPAVDETGYEDSLVKALKHLSPTENSILILRTMEERSFDEIGNILNLKAANVRKKYERLRRKLKKLLVQEEGGGTSYERYSISN